MKRYKKKKIFIILILLVILAVGVYLSFTKIQLDKNIPFIQNKKYYSKYDYLNVKSTVDFNDNQIDDYTDFVNGARKDALNKPRYDGKYISENDGYPPDDIGVCTDVIWRAFKEAGYNLRNMINKDINENISSYPRVEGKPNPNIDFRRVPNLRVFFQRHTQELTIHADNPEDWQMGDIIIFEPNEYHIGMCSDRRNKNGFPLVIHNSGQDEREEDILEKYKLSHHFRFDASKIEQEKLIRFE